MSKIFNDALWEEAKTMWMMNARELSIFYHVKGFWKELRELLRIRVFDNKTLWYDEESKSYITLGMQEVEYRVDLINKAMQNVYFRSIIGNAISELDSMTRVIKDGKSTTADRIMQLQDCPVNNYQATVSYMELTGLGAFLSILGNTINIRYEPSVESKLGENYMERLYTAYLDILRRTDANKNVISTYFSVENSGNICKLWRVLKMRYEG